MNLHSNEDQEDKGFRKVSSNGIWNKNGNLGAGVNARTPSALQPVTCPRCQDALWIVIEPTQSGQPRRLAPCSCQLESSGQQDHLRTYASLGHFVDRTFGNLKINGRKGKVDADSYASVVQHAKRFADEPSGWLVVSGPVAAGKSHIAAAVANHIIANGRPAKYISAMQIEEMLRNATFGSDSVGDEQTWHSVINAPVLILDDLGSHHSSDWIESRLDQLFTYRAANATPTLIVLSKPLNALSQRVRDRIEDSELCLHLPISPGPDLTASDDVVPQTMLDRMTFDSFDTSGAPIANRTEQDTLSMALAAAQRFAANPDKWLYLHGPTGVGKTHLAVAVAERTTRAGWSPTYWRTPDLLDNLRRTFADGAEMSFYDCFSSVRNAKLLILDDFIPYRMSDWTLEKLYQLICHRYDRLLPTVITSQYIIWEGVEDDRWEGLNGRVLWDSIKSRLADTSVVTERLMSAPDYRNRGA